jgi:hypothetical protein
MRSLFASFVLRRHKAAAHKRAVSSDPADMGTAFGLEASLNDTERLFDQPELLKKAKKETRVSSSPLAWLLRRSRR